MKIAVTGAFGFIGTYVLAELKRRNLNPIACARRAPAELSSDANTIAIFDIYSAQDAFERMGRPDTVIHLAWDGLPNYDSLHHIESELPAQYNFLKQLIESGLRNLVVTGTCFEYGMQSGMLSEDFSAEPSNPYGYAKNALRVQLQFLRQQQPFNLSWARLFYLFGDGQANTSLWPQLKAAIARRDNTFNMSLGEQLRDYLPAEDVAHALVALALSQTNNDIVNVCSGEPTSVRRLVENWLVKNNWSIQLKLGHYPYPTYEPMAFWGDNRKLKQILKSS